MRRGLSHGLTLIVLLGATALGPRVALSSIEDACTSSVGVARFNGSPPGKLDTAQSALGLEPAEPERLPAHKSARSALHDARALMHAQHFCAAGGDVGVARRSSEATRDVRGAIRRVRSRAHAHGDPVAA